MKTAKKITALLLCAMLTSGLLISCARSDTSDGGSETTAAQTTETASDDAHYKAAVPDRDFGGAEFRVAGVEPSTYPAISLAFDFEQEDGDIVNTAIYTRNRRIEEKYNVKFVTTYYPDWTGPIPVMKECALSGDDAFQLIMMINREAFAAAIAGYVMPLDSIPYTDDEQPWYMSKLNDMFSVAGERLLAYTDECLNAYLQTVCVLFNKGLVSDFALSDPYQLVRDGKWTADNFYTLAASVVTDVNGDGAYNADGDIFGVASEGDMFYPSMWVGGEIATVEKDADGIPVYSAPSDERLVSVIEKLSAYLKTPGAYCDSWKSFAGLAGDESRNAGTQYFAENKALFRVGCVGYIQLLRNMEADFGVLPLPKYDESQSSYYSRMLDGWLHVAPISVQNTELLGTMLEALGAESRNLVIPAFFDVALNDKLTRDTESEEMLNIIFNNVTADLGDTVWFSTIRVNICDAIAGGRGDITSMLTKLENEVQKNCIEKTLEALGK
ncbi:MAG: hypothetical protein WCQ72_04100 [Eubacteriales bacterium]